MSKYNCFRSTWQEFKYTLIKCILTIRLYKEIKTSTKGHPRKRKKKNRIFFFHTEVHLMKIEVVLFRQNSSKNFILLAKNRFSLNSNGSSIGKWINGGTNRFRSCCYFFFRAKKPFINVLSFPLMLTTF